MSNPPSGRTTPDVVIDPASPHELDELKHDPATTAIAGGSGPDNTLQPEPTEKGTKPRTNSGRSSRQNSPARLPTELEIKSRTQRSRIKTIESILNESVHDWSLDNEADLQVELSNLETIHSDFKETHQYLELNWPAAFIDHEYFALDFHGSESKLYRKCVKALSKLRAQFVAEQELNKSTASVSRREPKLPDIQLKSFSGEYEDWPSFKEMFEELIMKNTTISDIERLHYLRSCMSAGPAELIANFPLMGSSLMPSWQMLVARYDNKRLLIQAQLDKMCSLTKLTKKSAKGLNALISRVSEACKALDALGVSNNLGSCILVHHVCHHLDNATREAWENSLGSSHEFPSFSQLEEFLTIRARALERIEASAPVAANTSSTARPASTHHASAPQSSAKPPRDNSAYHCDCCNGAHYIITCAKFRNLDVLGRRKIASNCRLCYNCLGRHSSAACKSTKTCRHCGSKHHTMLHEELSRKPAPDSAKPSTSAAPQ